MSNEQFMENYAPLAEIQIHDPEFMQERYGRLLSEYKALSETIKAAESRKKEILAIVTTVNNSNGFETTYWKVKISLFIQTRMKGVEECAKVLGLDFLKSKGLLVEIPTTRPIIERKDR